MGVPLEHWRSMSGAQTEARALLERIWPHAVAIASRCAPDDPAWRPHPCGLRYGRMTPPSAASAGLPRLRLRAACERRGGRRTHFDPCLPARRADGSVARPDTAWTIHPSPFSRKVGRGQVCLRGDNRICGTFNDA